MIVEDHEVLRLGIAHVIRSRSGWELCGEAGNAIEALKLIRDAVPHLAILDLRLGHSDGLDLIKKVRETVPECRLLVLSSLDEDVFAERSIRAGAHGFLSKGEPLTMLLAAIEKVLGGHIYLSPRMTDRVLTSRSGTEVVERSALDSLSDREMDVYQRLGQGKATKEIAQELHLSPKTVEYHRLNIKKKLQLLTSAALIRHATAHVLGKEEENRS